MITRTPPLAESEPWVEGLRRAYTRPAALLADLGLEAAAVGLSATAAAHFAFRVPRAFAARMRTGDPRDPLLRQVLPVTDELLEAPGFVADPVGDLAARRAPGLLQKYAGRALLLLTGGCAINCRYCFRREFPYAADVGTAPLASALEVLRADSSVQEVILSGGDPLLWQDHRLEELCHHLAAIPQLQRLRIHSRLPVVLPARVTPVLAGLLARSRLQVVMVLHANHPREIDPAVMQACAELRAAGVTLLNQAVLLRGVNDGVETLAELSEALFASKVLPYYLHQLDRVRGTSHFEVPLDQALTLYRGLHARLPGYLLPRLVREIPGEPGKTLLA